MWALSSVVTRADCVALLSAALARALGIPIHVVFLDADGPVDSPAPELTFPDNAVRDDALCVHMAQLNGCFSLLYTDFTN